MHLIRRIAHVLLIVLTLIVGAGAAAIVVSQTAWFKDWLRGYIVREANQYLNGTLSIERLGGNLFFGIEMENVGLSVDGSQVVAAKDLGLKYNVFEIVTRGVSVSNIRLDKPVVYLRRDGDSSSLSRLVKLRQSDADRSGSNRPITIDDIGVSDGSVVVEGPVGTSVPNESRPRGADPQLNKDPGGGKAQAVINVPKRVDNIDAKLAFKYEPERYSIEITHVSFRSSEPSLALNALSGGIAVRGDTVYVDKLSVRTAETSIAIAGAVQQYQTKPLLNLAISSDKLSIPEIARVIPALSGVAVQPAFEVKLAGPLDRLGVDFNVRASAGQLTGQLMTNLARPGQSVEGNVSVRHIDLAPILNQPQQKSDISGEVHLNLRGSPLSDVNTLRGTLSAKAPRIAAAGYEFGPLDAKTRITGRQLAIDGRAAAYGARATTSGTVTLPGSTTPSNGKQMIAYDLRGQIHDVNLRQLPRSLGAPRATSRISGDYHVHSSAQGSATTADLRLEPSTLASAEIGAGSTLGVSVNGERIDYRADLTVANLDLQRVGIELDMQALENDQYKTTMNGHLALNGRGTRVEKMDVTASGNLERSTLLGGRIEHMAFDASLQHDAAHVKTNGTVADLDPSVATGKAAIKGSIGATFDVDTMLKRVSKGISADSVQADVAISLLPGTLGGLELSKTDLQGSYHDSVGDIRRLEIVGRDVNVSASGRLSLNDRDDSNLTVHADSPSLDQLGKLVGTAGEPLKGIAKIDATVTGNKRSLQASGHVVGDGLGYGSGSALALTSDFSATVPELSISDATIVSDSHGTFMTLAGLNINELTAKTTYQQKQLDFDATAKQPQRSLDAAGSLLLRPEAQELRLQRLVLQTQRVTWQLTAGAEPKLKYTSDASGSERSFRVELQDLKLVSGNQEISADGAFGSPTSGEGAPREASREVAPREATAEGAPRKENALNIKMSNVDLAGVDALLLRPPQFSGTLNAASTITGTTASPHVTADFRVEQGGFRQFHYQTLGGNADYNGTGIRLDARLEQTPTTWLEAKGYVPVAAFKTSTGGAGGSAPANADQFDLHLDSSSIDLGIVQGFTTAITNVGGTLQAKLDITGPADDPRPSGAITVDNAKFLVPATGVAYTDLTGKIDLQPDRVHIDEIRVLDNHRQPLSISGDLALHERTVGGVSISLECSDFKVIDNKMGNLRLNTNLRIAGELTAPRVEGDLGVTTGQLDLDQILAKAASSPYATAPTQYSSESQEQQSSSTFDALQMGVRLTVPNDLVIKASDLQTPGAPIGLGALNLTLGGNVWVGKTPSDQPRLSGIVNTIRGTYDFQGRRFNILRDGNVRFEGDAVNDLDPELDIRTERVIQAVTARVNVRGSLKQPQIALESTPPLEQADILALIVFNQPVNQLGEGQQIALASRAQQLATGAVAGQLARSIAGALNLDTFEINTAPDSGSAAQVTVGQQVGQNLYVKAQQGLGDLSQINFLIEYELARWLRLRTNVLQGSSTQQQLFQRMQGSGVDLLFFFSY